MRGKRGLSCLLAAGLCLGLLGGCSDGGSTVAASLGDDTLTVGVRELIPGFSSYNETTGKYTGLEVDIAEELASRLGYDEVEFVTVHADDREEILASGEVDCLVATVTVTDERLETMDFSPEYYKDETVLLVEKSSQFSGLSDLAGKTIGIVEGSATKGLLSAKLADLGLKPVTFVAKTLYSDLDSLLETGEVDALCLDGCVAQAYLTDGRMLLDETLDESSYGVATVKGSELSEPIAQAVQEMLDDGTVETLIDKWN